MKGPFCRSLAGFKSPLLQMSGEIHKGEVLKYPAELLIPQTLLAVFNLLLNFVMFHYITATNVWVLHFFAE